MRKTKGSFRIGSEKVKVVYSYKYLGCVIDKSLDMKQMIRAQEEAGRRAFCEWLTYCRTSISEIKGGTFLKLMQALVDSVLLYG